MNAALRSARGASAFTEADSPVTRSAVDAGAVVSGSGDAPPQTWADLIDELLRIRQLKDDWDGEGAEAPHPALVDGAITLAQALQAGGHGPADRVIAGVNGTVYFEWHTPLGYEEIEVTSPTEAECRWMQTDSDHTKVVSLCLRR